MGKNNWTVWVFTSVDTHGVRCLMGYPLKTVCFRSGPADLESLILQKFRDTEHLTIWNKPQETALLKRYQFDTRQIWNTVLIWVAIRFYCRVSRNTSRLLWRIHTVRAHDGAVHLRRWLWFTTTSDTDFEIKGSIRLEQYWLSPHWRRLSSTIETHTQLILPVFS